MADSGAEIFLNKFKNPTGTTLNDLGSGLSCNPTTNVITGDIGTGKDYEITAYAEGSTTPLACGAPLNAVKRIKSIGSCKNTSRAVEMAVAANTTPGITGGCELVLGTVDEIADGTRWGSGCVATPRLCNTMEIIV